MILEGIVTTLDTAGALNIAPMGPHVAGPEFDRFLLRPYPTSQTYQNLKHSGEGVLHVSDDVFLLAQAAVGAIDPAAAVEPASSVHGFILRDACRIHEFRVTALDESEPRVRIECQIVRTERRRDFFGFNRAKHAVVEAAILATRTAFLPRAEIEAELRRLEPLVQKTGGEREREAFAFLVGHVTKTWDAVASLVR
jgi:hypothetical protein